jgi:hypothetical protein
MRNQISELRQLISIEEREKQLYSVATHCGNPQDIISYRDDANQIDIFLMEFDSHEDAYRAKMLMGFSQIADSNVASIIIPSSYLH